MCSIAEVQIAVLLICRGAEVQMCRGAECAVLPRCRLQKNKSSRKISLRVLVILCYRRFFSTHSVIAI